MKGFGRAKLGTASLQRTLDCSGDDFTLPFPASLAIRLKAKLIL